MVTVASLVGLFGEQRGVDFEASKAPRSTPLADLWEANPAMPLNISQSF